MQPSNTLPGFHSPGASTEAPLEMLAACHGRVQHQCNTLQRLDAHLVSHGSDQAAREAAQAVTRYFDLAAPHHHADEEQDLFPRLLDAAAGSDAVSVRELTERLRTDHRELERRWRSIRDVLATVTQGQPAQFGLGQIENFVSAYDAHIRLEEAELLPMAQRLLDDTQLQAVGLAMRQRRGIETV